jgi:hypothetical protein
MLRGIQEYDDPRDGVDVHAAHGFDWPAALLE